MPRPRNLIAASAVALALLGGASASAAPVFFDNFSQEALQLDAALDNWTVSDGTVDVVGTGFFAELCNGGPSADRCVDLDGSTFNAGRITSNGISLGTGTYEFSFWARGNNRNAGPDTVRLGVETNVMPFTSLTLASTDGWQQFLYTFTLTAPEVISLVFDHAGNDNMGILLDNVAITQVPEPASLSLALLALGSAFAARRRR
ncbi:MAG: PEP-CTERM sorting domain-containing protein [Acidobacteria bacterium]|nr:PEP-CTERM sorting domain-containing protein [Acidobacteriota bacterium]